MWDGGRVFVGFDAGVGLRRRGGGGGEDWIL